MKKLTIVMFALALLMPVSTWAQKRELNDVQKKAQRSLIDMLRTKKFSPTIDSNDQSVCFKKGDVLYWINIDGNDAPLLYTMHCKNIRFADEKDKGQVLTTKREIAVKAANMIEETKLVKATMKEFTIDFSMPVYADEPESYQKVFDKVLAAFDGVRKDFDENYKKCRAEVHDIHSHWYDLDTARIVIEQKGNVAIPETSTLTMADEQVDVRVVEANGTTVISDYGKSIYQSNCHFIQPKIRVKATQVGAYKLGVKMYTPSGKLLVPSKDATFTTVTPVVIAKANKPQEVELNKFGSDSKKWAPGEYRIDIYEGDTKIKSHVINIL